MDSKKTLHPPHALYGPCPEPFSRPSPGLHPMPRQHRRHPTRNSASLPPRHHPANLHCRRPLRHHPRPLQTQSLIRINTRFRSSKGEENPVTREQNYKAFKALHERTGTFVIPNPWNAGTAKILTALGFEALATTSAGYAFSIGQEDST